MHCRPLLWLTSLCLSVSVALPVHAQFRARLGAPEAIAGDHSPVQGKKWNKDLTRIADANAPFADRQKVELLPAPRSFLTLDQVIASVNRHYPLLFAKQTQRQRTRGEFQSSFGKFDLNLNGHSLHNVGSFDNNRYRIGFEQALGYRGIQTFAGYRLGRGDFPVYYQDRLTAQGGEFSAGARLPILRDLSIDKPRAAVAKTRLGLELAEADIAQSQLDFVRQGSLAYWQWVGAFQRYRIARNLLAIAERRDEYLRKRLKAGAVSAIEVTDNMRTIVDRRARLIAFQRGYEKASISLSLFLRDDGEQPIRPDALWNAPDFAMPAPPRTDKIASDVALALNNRPELQSFAVRRKQLEVDLAMYENQLLPNLDVLAKGAQDVGQGKSSLDRATYEAGLILSVPLQRRFARGKILATQAKLAELNAQQNFIRDRITAEVQDVASALNRLSQLCQMSRQNVEINLQMERAEIRKFELGKSNMLFVNLRELNRAEAQFQQIDAFVRFYEAVADYYATLGIALAGGSRPLHPLAQSTTEDLP